MSSEQSSDAASQRLATWYSEHSDRIRAFLVGVLRNRDAAEEALQATFAKAVTASASVQSGSERAWLFQVAFNEALVIRRRWEREKRHLDRLRASPPSRGQPPVDADLLRWETVQRIQQAIESLPVEQRQVVWRRMYEEQTFQQIADELQLPLGTILTRMRLALKKLAATLKRDN